MRDRHADDGGRRTIRSSAVLRQEGHRHGTRHARSAARRQILWVNVPAAEIPPGRDAQGVRHLPPVPRRRGDPAGRVRAAARSAGGHVQFIISGWEQYLSDEQIAKPFRFAAETSRSVRRAARHDERPPQRGVHATGAPSRRRRDRPHGDAEPAVVAPAGAARRRAKQHDAVRQLDRRRSIPTETA